MSWPNRHSLLWKLLALLAAFCLALVWLGRSWGGHMERKSYMLSAPARHALAGYGRQAQNAWESGGAAAVDAWLAAFQAREGTWATVVSPDLQPLGTQGLTAAEVQNLTFMRQLHWPMSPRGTDAPIVGVPFPGAPGAGQLVVRLPGHLLPRGFGLAHRVLLHSALPAVVALLLGALLYRLLVAPLTALQAQANALRGDNLARRVAPAVTARRDELGDLGRAFDHMSDRLQGTLDFQRQLLRSLSHELRTPLSRLQVVADREADNNVLRARLRSEVAGMRGLVDDALELVWLDTERPALALAPVEVNAVWELLRDNACYESGWVPEQLPATLPPGCCVLGHLNGLAQAMENVLRNAIRYSPADGQVRLNGQVSGRCWHLWIDDQGPGVAEGELERIFEPFVRLDSDGPGASGFGLGLAIARSRVRLQGGEMWAERLASGLRINLRLPMYIL